MTVEYWKSAPYLMSFMRGYKVKSAVDDAWKEATCGGRWSALFADREAHRAAPDVEQYRHYPSPTAVSSARRPGA